ncbi:2-hydroxyacid dehydrogenase [Rhodalgimonas zhirmunskyi]|uniref:D-glycerate dehydrogenase n=1 Tax=Rhodalgimonas zhirmunskyi TaxID=2964767 RepID=A0AAJ1X512_9RHOB|nr:D-glycerate dehydrogenase [Rhodoalgimonas zhirmunskyi]MDQ2093694.1 D-glycerate dehydrogenase [Rhodoalgimonas zhirmunskyi]
MTRLLITREMPERVQAAARALPGADVTLRDDAAPLSPEAAQQALYDYDVILPTLGDGFGEAAFSRADPPRARLLANFGVGFNHIDVAAARRRGIAVTNTPGAVTDATADIALTLILMSTRRAGEGERMLRAGCWTGWEPTQLLGLHVSGKTVGIIGMGRIGQAIARRCHYGFGMTVIFSNRSEKQLDFPAEQMPQHELARHADIIVIAVPGGRETHHLIGPGFLSSMRPHAHLVNISRGDVIDETALIAALEAGQIAGAGLDVYEHEPDVPDALRRLENVTLLPHLGTAALEVREAMGLMAIDNIRALIAGETLPNPVN